MSNENHSKKLTIQEATLKVNTQLNLIQLDCDTILDISNAAIIDMTKLSRMIASSLKAVNTCLRVLTTSQNKTMSLSQSNGTDFHDLTPQNLSTRLKKYIEYIEFLSSQTRSYLKLNKVEMSFKFLSEIKASLITLNKDVADVIKKLEQQQNIVQSSSSSSSTTYSSNHRFYTPEKEPIPTFKHYPQVRIFILYAEPRNSAKYDDYSLKAMKLFRKSLDKKLPYVNSGETQTLLTPFSVSGNELINTVKPIAYSPSLNNRYHHLIQFSKSDMVIIFFNSNLKNFGKNAIEALVSFYSCLYDELTRKEANHEEILTRPVLLIDEANNQELKISVNGLQLLVQNKLCEMFTSELEMELAEENLGNDFEKTFQYLAQKLRAKLSHTCFFKFEQGSPDTLAELLEKNVGFLFNQHIKQNQAQQQNSSNLPGPSRRQ